MAGKRKPQQQAVGFWQMVRDVLIASMNKGQFPPALVGMIALAMIVKMPAGDVTKLAFEILNDLKAGYLFGYAGFAASITGWSIHVRWQRREITAEMKRIADARTRAQRKQLGDEVRSSN